MLSSRRTVTSSGMVELSDGWAACDCPGPGIGNRDRRMNLRCDSSMNSAASSKHSGLRGASTSSAFGYSPCKVPNAMSACGSSVATTLPATMIGDRPLRLSSVASQFDNGVGAGSSRSYFKFPLTRTRSAGAPRARKRSASFSLCMRKAPELESTLFRKGRKKKPKTPR